MIYPLSKLSKDLRYSLSSITRAFAELENAQLVERVRNGFSKPSRILLKVPYTTQNCAVTVCKNAKDDCAETSSIIAQKCTPNQRNKSNLKDSHLIRTTDAHLTFGESPERKAPKATREYAAHRLDTVLDKFLKTMQTTATRLQEKLLKPDVRQKSKEQIKEKARDSVLQLLSRLQAEQAQNKPAAQPRTQEGHSEI